MNTTANFAKIPLICFCALVLSDRSKTCLKSCRVARSTSNSSARCTMQSSARTPPYSCRDALEGIGLPAKNLVPLEQVEQQVAEAQEAAKMQEQAELARTGAEAARDMGQAEANMAQAANAA